MPPFFRSPSKAWVYVDLRLCLSLDDCCELYVIRHDFESFSHNTTYMPEKNEMLTMRPIGSRKMIINRAKQFIKQSTQTLTGSMLPYGNPNSVKLENQSKKYFEEAVISNPELTQQ
jgi:hypothetical protein